MEENKTLAAEEVAENVEQTTEETQPSVKTYTQDEVNEIVGKAKARAKAKIQKEHDRMYGDLIETLKAGTGKEDIGEINEAFRDFYAKKGVDLPQKSEYSARDIEVLARAEADDIIRSGDDEVIEEVNRLAELGADKMTAKEKAVFKALAEHRKTAERNRELSEIGVAEDVYNSDEFKEFASKFTSETSVKDIYDIYSKTKPKKEFKTMGSMKSTVSDDSAVKDYYSFEEASKFTKADFDKNPALFAAVEKSMAKW